MSNNLTQTATADINAFQDYYEQYEYYRKCKKDVKEADKAKKEYMAALTKAKNDLANHKNLRDSYIEEKYNEALQNRSSVVERTFAPRIKDADKKINDCAARIDSLAQGGRSRDVIFKETWDWRCSAIRDALHKNVKKVRTDLDSFRYTLSDKVVNAALDAGRERIISSNSYDYAHSLLNNPPPDYIAKEKINGASLLTKLKNTATAIFKPPFIFNFDGRKRWSKGRIIGLVLYYAAIGALLYFGFTSGILMILLLIAALIIALAMFLPGILVKSKLNNAAAYYVVVDDFVNRDGGWMHTLVNRETDSLYAVEYANAGSERERLSGVLAQLQAEKAAIIAERDSAITGVSADDIRAFAEGSFNDELKRLEELHDEAEQKSNKLNELIDRAKRYIKEFTKEENVKTNIEKIEKWKDEEHDKSWKNQKTEGKMWDRIFTLDEDNKDDDGAPIISCIVHNMNPQVLLYECDSSVPANELCNYVALTAMDTISSYPKDFVRVYVIDTVGGAAAYNKFAGKLLEPIGKLERIKTLEEEVRKVQEKISSDIGTQNKERIDGGNAPYPYTIAFIFIPAGEVSANSNVLSEALKVQIRHKGTYGFLPIFLIGRDDWFEQDNSKNKAVEELKTQFVDKNDVHLLNYKEMTISDLMEVK